MSTFKLIVFDCDGTLVDSQHLIVDAMQRAFIGEGLISPERSAILRTVGLSVPEAVRILSPRSEAASQARLAAAYREWCFSLRQESAALEPLFDGAADFLRALAGGNGFVLGIATGKSRRGVSRLIETEGLHGLFATIQTADDAPSKPSPQMLLQAMAETGARAEDTLMVGDSVFDITMALSAGVTPVAVSWGYYSPRDLRKAGARHTVRSFVELSSLLAGLGASVRELAAAG